MRYFTALGAAEGLNALPANPCRRLDFARLVLRDGGRSHGPAEARERVLVLIGGRCTIAAGDHTFAGVGARAGPFDGKPYAVYLPPGTPYTVVAHSDLEIGICAAPADHPGEPYLITPDAVVARQIGSNGFTREIRTILTASDQPAFPAHSLIVGETLVPGGNWSTYPPHRHEVANLPHEAQHEEMYYFRIDPPQGFGLVRHYSPERGYDTAYTVTDGTILMAPHGFHTTCSAPGYTNYFLWFLAGDGRTQAVQVDPDHAWVQERT